MRRGLALAVLVALVLGGCGRQVIAGNRIAGHTLTIYSDLPLEGPSAAGARTVLEGERLALQEMGGRIGPYVVRLKALDDASIPRAGWDPGQTTVNAHIAAEDPTTIGYLGDLNSGATAIAIPVLNRAGIVQISPTSTAVGLTSDGPGASPGEPGKYYPSGKQSFVALAPDDAAQAAAQVQLQLTLGCTHTYVLDDGEFDGYDAAASFQLVARGGGLMVVGAQAYPRQAPSYLSLARAVAQTGADCVLVSGLPESGAARITRAVAAVLPHAQIFATAALAQPSFADPAEGGIPAALDSRVLITAPAAGAGTTDGSFRAAYTRHFGAPGPYAAYGYQAMRLLLSALAEATEHGHKRPERSAVINAVLDSRVRTGPLGPFHVQADGATTLRAYGIYRIVHGRLAVWDTGAG